MKKVILILTTLFNLSASGQENLTQMAKPIVIEGKRLYKSEMASWYGTDIFMEKYKNIANIGGYFSYIENDTAKCIFFSKSDQPQVIGTISFDSTYNIKTAKTDLIERNFTLNEKEIYTIRKIALDTIKSDTFFKKYKNTNLNLVPLISGKEKKVYILTGPENIGVVIFGNDYLLTFDSINKLSGKKQLHKNIILTYYGGKEAEVKKTVGAVHSHLPETGDFITSTDICTLMLYEKFAKWKEYNVVSKNYLNIWNCLTDSLIVVPLGNFDKLKKDK